MIFLISASLKLLLLLAADLSVPYIDPLFDLRGHVSCVPGPLVSVSSLEVTEEPNVVGNFSVLLPYHDCPLLCCICLSVLGQPL